MKYPHGTKSYTGTAKELRLLLILDYLFTHPKQPPMYVPVFQPSEPVPESPVYDRRGMTYRQCVSCGCESWIPNKKKLKLCTFCRGTYDYNPKYLKKMLEQLNSQDV